MVLYDSPEVGVIQGDCLSVLRALPDGCVDAVITDPPYNVGLKYSGDDSADQKQDYADWCAVRFAHLKRVSKGPILVSCGIANLGLWHNIEEPRWVCCWWKPASSGRCAIGFNNWEPVLVYGKGLRSVCDVIRTTEQAALPVQHKKQAIAHPCPKPVEWAQKQVKMLKLPPHALILDPFAGSGTTGIAAALEGRRCLLIEKEPAYAAIARERVRKALGKDGLFAEVA